MALVSHFSPTGNRGYRRGRFHRLDGGRQFHDRLRFQVDPARHGPRLGVQLGAVLVGSKNSSERRYQIATFKPRSGMSPRRLDSFLSSFQF